MHHGRMGVAQKGLELFLSNDEKEVEDIANELNKYNKLRQDTEKEIIESAIEKIETKKLYENNTLVVSGENWHHGVIGIVASKITDRYFKPSILLSFEEDGIGKGSGRSIPGFNIHEALIKCQDKIERFGGHTMAIGISIKKENLEEFQKSFEKIAKVEKTDEILPSIMIDGEIELSKIDKQMVKSLNELEPFGEANRMPIFVFKNLKIDSIRTLSEGKHIKLTLKENATIVSAIGFNIGEIAKLYTIGDKIDVVGTLEINSFNNIENIQINIKDIKKSI